MREVPTLMDWYLVSLWKVLRAVMGSDPKSYYDAAMGKYGGAFFDFARLVFPLDKTTDSALEKANWTAFKRTSRENLES